MGLKRILQKAVRSPKTYLRYFLFMKRRLFNRLIGFVLSLVGCKTLKMYWYDFDVNFGDTIGPEFIKKIGYYPIYTRQNMKLVSAGSILDMLPETYSGIIAGSGFIHAETVKRFPEAKVLGVRGRLTLEKLKPDHPEHVVLGDPGLIASDLIKHDAGKVFPLGIVPHYTDKSNPTLRQLINNHKKDIFVIDVSRNITAVANDIARCEKILSSSLHGCIVSDGLGIPNAWVKFSDLVGGDFKFADYYSVFGIHRSPKALSGTEGYETLLGSVHDVPEQVPAVQKQLRDMFCHLAIVLNSH